MAKEYSRINSKGLLTDELTILARVNKEGTVLFKDLAKEYQKDHISRIVRSLAVKGLVDLAVIKRKTAKKSKPNLTRISPEEERVRLEAILKDPDLLKKAYNDYLKEPEKFLSPVYAPSKMETPHTLEEFRELLRKRHLHLLKRGLPIKNMKVGQIISNQKGHAFEDFIKQTITDIVERINKGEISSFEALEEISKFKQEGYTKFNELFKKGKVNTPQ